MAMTVKIRRDGTLDIWAGGDPDEYALTKWFQDACDGKTQVMLTAGTLQMGPQPVKLLAVAKE